VAVFKELDPELHLKLIEGYTDELSPEAKSLELFYRLHSRCKRCGELMQKEFDGRTAWESDDAMPHALLRCTNCGMLLEPFTGLVLDTGSPAKIPTSISPRLEPDD
jgi:hypothetical protein